MADTTEGGRPRSLANRKPGTNSARVNDTWSRIVKVPNVQPNSAKWNLPTAGHHDKLRHTPISVGVMPWRLHRRTVLEEAQVVAHYEEERDVDKHGKVEVEHKVAQVQVRHKAARRDGQDENVEPGQAVHDAHRRARHDGTHHGHRHHWH